MTMPTVMPPRKPCFMATIWGSRSFCRYLAASAFCPLKAITVRMLLSACTSRTLLRTTNFTLFHAKLQIKLTLLMLSSRW